MGTGEALLKVRSRGGQSGAKGASMTNSEEFDFQGELQKFDKVSDDGVWVAIYVRVFTA